MHVSIGVQALPSLSIEERPRARRHRCNSRGKVLSMQRPSGWRT